MVLFISFLFVAIAEGHVKNLPMLVRQDLLATLQASWGTSVALMPVEYFCFSRLPLPGTPLQLRMRAAITTKP